MKPLKKIEKQNIEDMLALTPMQEGMLFHYLNDPQGQQYFVQLNLEITGEIDINVFKKAWNLTEEIMQAKQSKIISESWQAAS